MCVVASIFNGRIFVFGENTKLFDVKKNIVYTTIIVIAIPATKLVIIVELHTEKNGIIMINQC